MFMKDDAKKRIASLIISKREGDSEEIQKAPMTEEKVTSDYDMGMETAAEELLSAVESKSASSIVDAMKSLITMINDEHEDMERSNPEGEA